MAEFKIIAAESSEGPEQEDWTKKPCLPFTGWIFLDPEDGFTFGDDQDIPGWLDYEMGEIGIDYMLDIGVDHERWALREGVAPGQPFLIRIEPPRYYQDYWGECDVEYEWELLDKKPYTDAMALEAWLAWFKGLAVEIPLVDLEGYDRSQRRSGLGR